MRQLRHPESPRPARYGRLLARSRGRGSAAGRQRHQDGSVKASSAAVELVYIESHH